MKNIEELFSSKNSNRMPAIFVGHGSPMNAIEQNEFTEMWQFIGKNIPKPKLILSVSAHWETDRSQATAMDKPKTIHDFGGFPHELYKIQYPADGYPQLIDKISLISENARIAPNFDWGLDHGTWSVLIHMFPDANIPVVQLSLDFTKSPEEHYLLGKEIGRLRDEGVLVIGSGNIVHNLRQLYVEDGDFNKELAHRWAIEFNNRVKECLIEDNVEQLIDYKTITEDWYLSVPTPEHYTPLLYILGTKLQDDDLSIFNDKIIAGAISMSGLIYK